MDFSLSGNDTITIDGLLITQFTDKNYGHLTWPQEQVQMKLGKLANTAIINFNAAGVMAELTIRLLAGGDQDAYLNSRNAEWRNDPPSFELISGQVVKRLGDGSGGVANVPYNLYGGVVVKPPEGVSSSEGDEEQGTAVWMIRFAYGERAVV